MEQIKPILFNTEMVRAIIAGRKAQTRRAIKTPAEVHESPNGTISVTKPRKYPDEYCRFVPYAPIEKGDTLWVRETWAKSDVCTAHGDVRKNDKLFYRADYPNHLFEATTEEVESDFLYTLKWRPSIHMPKEAARLFLQVTNVRVGRLQDITTEDICSEGVWVEPPPAAVTTPKKPAHYDTWPNERKVNWYNEMARSAYIAQCDHVAALHSAWGKLWDSTIKPDDIDKYGWSANPWVWVYDFERLDNPQSKAEI